MPGPHAYERIAALLRTRITAGEFRPGKRLPSERTLAQRHHVSAGVVRAAIRLLREEGVVETMPGSGSYVRDHRREEEIAQLTRRVEELEQLVRERAAMEARIEALERDVRELRERDR